MVTTVEWMNLNQINDLEHKEAKNNQSKQEEKRIQKK